LRKSNLFLAQIGALTALFIGMFVHAEKQEAMALQRRQVSLALVRSLGLTDLCLFTEARYTRNPAMADRHAAFQDHPMGLDHFPSGSLVTPPSFPSPHAPNHPALSKHP
jgi:hypothetical protein